MKVRYKKVETINEFIDAIRLRVDVFIKEQGFEPGWEPDEADKEARSFIAIVGKKVVATARMRKIGREIKIERMAVAKDQRGKGVGKGLVKFLVKEATKEKPKRIWMQSQLHAKSFYGKCGFVAVSKPYNYYGVKHIDMDYKNGNI